jgi:hypothetical protein
MATAATGRVRGATTSGRRGELTALMDYQRNRTLGCSILHTQSAAEARVPAAPLHMRGMLSARACGLPSVRSGEGPALLDTVYCSYRRRPGPLGAVHLV